ncbi:MAG: hypothetical protein GXX90_09625, partial [Microbacteriaceae bacterium]|nr:hypothetical protein [Microbacteriaceae bacterium]
ETAPAPATAPATSSGATPAPVSAPATAAPADIDAAAIADAIADAVAARLVAQGLGVFDAEAMLRDFQSRFDELIASRREQEEETEQLQNAVSELENDVLEFEELVEKLENESLVAADQRIEADQARRRLEWELGQARQQLGPDWSAHGGTETREEPRRFNPGELVQELNSFLELHEFIDDHMRDTIELCIDEDRLLELDDSVSSQSPISRALNAVITFDTYVRARRLQRFDGTLISYLKQAEHPFYMGITDFSNESRTVGNTPKMAQERRRAVPTGFRSDGIFDFEWHVKFSAGRLYPRIYFEDGYAEIGKVLIGDIGRHLTNTKTN